MQKDKEITSYPNVLTLSIRWLNYGEHSITREFIEKVFSLFQNIFELGS